MATERRAQRQLFILLLSIFVGTIGHGILSPLVPQLFTGRFALFPGVGLGIYGALVAVFPLSQFFSSFILSGISDRTGRKRVLLLALWGTAAGYLLFVVGLLTRNLSLLFIARAVDGITGGSIGITQAAVADLTSKQERTAKISLIGGAFGLGIIFGPLLGGTLATLVNVQAPFLVAGAIAAFNATLIWMFLPALPPVSQKAGLAMRELGAKLLAYVAARPLRNLLAAGFLYDCAMTGFNAFFAVYLVVRFGFNAEAVGYFYTYVGILYALNQFLIVPHVSRRWQFSRILPLTIFGLAVILLLYAVIFFWPLLLIVAPALTILNGISQTNITGGLSISATSDEQGKVLGLRNSLFSLAQTIAPPLVGLGASYFFGAFPMLLGAAFMFGSLLLIRKLQPEAPRLSVEPSRL